MDTEDRWGCFAIAVIFVAALYIAFALIRGAWV